MQKLLLICLALCFSAGMVAQPIYVDQFDDGVVSDAMNTNFAIAEANNETTITGLGTNGAFAGVYFDFGGQFDITESPSLFVRAKASEDGTPLRFDLVDGDGTFSNMQPITVEVTTDYVVYEFDFSTVSNPDVDLSTIQATFMYPDPTFPGFTAVVALDFIALGEAPFVAPMSDIYQDLMDSDSSAANFGFVPDPFTVSRTADENGELTHVSISGDGTSGEFQPLAYQIRPAPDYLLTPVDMTDEPSIFIKARAATAGTVFRVDIQDIDNLSSNLQAVRFELADTFRVFEYSFEEANAIAFPGTACTEENLPCALDRENIKELLIYIDPGTGAFAGQIDIDYISFGVSLDPPEPAAPQIYVDDFDNDRVDFTGPTEGFEVSESGGSLNIAGNGTSSQFGTISYDFNDPSDDQDTARVARLLDFTEAQNKLFIRARTDGAPQTLRIDVADTTGLSSSNNTTIVKTISSEWRTYEYNFSGNYTDFGYGGAEGCSPDTPCPVDATAIKSIFMYVRPGVGMFEGNIEIDYISIGQPIEGRDVESAVGIVNFSDTLANAAGAFEVRGSGLAAAVDNDILTITGDGTATPFQQVRLNLQDADGGAAKADLVGSSNTLFVRARVRNLAEGDEGVDIRIDMADEAGFESTNAGSEQTIMGEEFANYRFTYGGASFEDGGYGGTACSMGPCPVDGQRITAIVMYPDDGEGLFSGDIDIEWISFGQEIMESTTAVRDFAQLDMLRFFPNPATDQLGVEFNLPTASDVHVSIFDGLGRRVINRDLGVRQGGNNFQALDVSDLAVGTYHVQMVVNGQAARAVTILKR
ncbi:T9SS type A sorting domain-containing protein [Lewinella sp. 4G2]|uniref:T9SS type A sorting domain-containing protein n=1 Tax=Lewinella sp. 4G2 TaxID=1803372 RepID=UPI0007B47948|nr:T9SS type A sorting domain-containing protein [Lewinella sp. 4G2]OAV45332.1 hypothetical protein A3850_012885 [Lewinella sp. 4G2]